MSILLTYNCQAQNTYPQDGDNITNNNLDKFVGTWNWSGNGKSFQLILKKENVLLPMGNNIKADMLYGFHKYTQNNIVVENSTQYSNTSYTSKKHTVSGMGDHNIPNKIGGGITHISKNKSIRYEIDYLDSTHIKLIKLENSPGIKLNVSGQIPYDSSISLPQDIILTKQ